jgi:glycerol-3-phosphate dehydrogenase
MTAFDRGAALARLAAEEFDVLVIGGGITGAGVALDAASRGLRTALVERHDFASGTSSVSSKFVHGGLRYLRQHDYRLVVESLVEQRRLLRNAPYLVQPVPVLLPVAGGRARRMAAAAALSLHDLTGGTGHGRTAPSGVVFHEAQVDDARLTLTVLQTAALHHGATAVNRCRVVGLEKDRTGRVRAVELADGLRAAVRSVVNATGVWAEEVASLDVGAPGQARLRPAKGVHLTVPRSALPFETAVVLPADGEGRWVFLAPWEDRAIVGTTDTDYDGPLDAATCTDGDVEDLLGAVNPYLPHPLTRGDVLACWAGLRPLLADVATGRTTDLSRRHQVSAAPSGVVTIVGGKLTTYRRMAADAVDEVIRLLGIRRRPSVTARLPLHGVGRRPPEVPDRLWRRYGTEAPAVLALTRAEPHLADPLVPGLPYLKAEAVWAVRHEMALTADDVLARRTRARFLDQAAAEKAEPEVTKLIAAAAATRRRP